MSRFMTSIKNVDITLDTLEKVRNHIWLNKKNLIKYIALGITIKVLYSLRNFLVKAQNETI